MKFILRRLLGYSQALQLSNSCQHFENVHILVQCNGLHANAKSLLELLMLEARSGAHFFIRVLKTENSLAEALFNKIKRLIRRCFVEALGG